MQRDTKIKIIFLLAILCICPANADEFNPPGSIKFCGWVSHCNEIGVWWQNATDADFNGVQIWFDDVYQLTTPPEAHFYNPNTPVVGSHTISTHTVDSWGNANGTWVNITVSLGACPECKEGWLCGDEFCQMPTGTPTVTPTTTPTSWVNVTLAPTDICRIRADMGETWIKWDVVCNTSVEVLYYIDGEKLENTTPYEPLDPDRLILSDLNSLETHNLKIYYLGEVIAESEITTLPAWYMLLLFIVISLILSVIGLLFISSAIVRILLAALALSIAVWMMTITTGWMLAVPVLPALFAGIVIILALRDAVEHSWGN